MEDKEKTDNGIKNGNNNKNKTINKEISEGKKIISNIIKKSIQCSKKTQEISSKILDSILCKDKEKLKLLCEDGLPDELPELRSLIWKINIGYLPFDMEKWDEVLKSKRISYKLYKNSIFEKLKKEMELLVGYEKLDRKERIALNKKTHKLILEDICKDTNRTHNEMSFFLKPIDKNKIFTEDEIIKLFEKKQNCNLKNINDTYKINIELTNSDIISKILFIYTKFEPELSYVQGMNEILAPIYYCFSLDCFNDYQPIDNIEADSFYTFYFLMIKLKSLFNKNEDNKDKGINGKTKRLTKMLEFIDNNLYNYLTEIKFDFSILVFRWISLLFSQNFEMIDLIRLWDYLFSNENIMERCYYISLAMILLKKDEITHIRIINDVYKIFQNTSDLFVENIITNAKYISQKCGKKCSEIIYAFYKDK